MAHMVDRYRCAYHAVFTEPGKKFLIPFLVDANAIENVDVAPLNEHQICTSALLAIFNMCHSR